MKNSIKISALFILGVLVTGIMHSCQKGSSVDANALSDDQLISAIQSSGNKQAIIEDELPSASQTTITSDYYESFTSQALMVPELGYEVQLRKGKGSQIGVLHYAYFDMNGRELYTSALGQGKMIKKQNGKQTRMGKDCFDFVLPITFTMPDASIISIETIDNWADIKVWYQLNSDSQEKPLLNFPVNMVYNDGSTITVLNEVELQALHQTCVNEVNEMCFEYVYPLTHMMPDSSEITGTSREEIALAISAWYSAHPDATERPVLTYPLEILFANGTSASVNSFEEMLLIKEDCGEQYRNGRNKCFELVYPVTFIMADETEIMVSDLGDKDAIIAWYTANAEVVEKPALKFPVNIVYADGTIATVISQEEMHSLRQACTNDHKGQGKENSNGKQGKGGKGQGGRG